MKSKLLLSAVFMLMLLVANAQNIQIKKGVVLKDKEPVAKLEGEATLLKGAHMAFKSMTDEPIMSVDERLVSFKNFFQDPLIFYTMRFPTANQVYIKELDQRFTSEKKIVENLYKEFGPDFLTKDGINKDIITGYVPAHDESKQIHEDTTYVFELCNQSTTQLNKAVPNRNKEARIEFNHFNIDELKWKGREYWREKPADVERTTLSIIQDNVLLGVVIKDLTKSPLSGQFTEAKYYILRKVTPFTVQGDQVMYANMAMLKTDMDPATATISVAGEKTTRSFQKISNFTGYERDLIMMLIQEGQL